MHHDYAYQCPHCGESIRIADNVMGGVVDCPVCESPFKVDLPTARPADEDQIRSDMPSIDRPDRAEDDLRTVHPAMFRTHPVLFVGYGLLVAIGLAGLVLALLDRAFIGQTFQMIVCGGLALLGGALFLQWWLKTRYTTLTVTTKRTILRRGIVAKNTTEVQHDDVRNIQVDQNMYERVVGVGDLAVSSSGQDDLEIHVDGIPEPDQIAEVIRDLQ